LAGSIVGEACGLRPVPTDSRQIERNFFSTFFLVVTELLTGRSPLLPLYAMVNQGMRAWVTACDNLLDDEYKEIFPFDLPPGRGRTQSVLTLLIADRVLTEFMLDRFDQPELMRTVGRISPRALVPSALQECEEESAYAGAILPPPQILGDVRTGRHNLLVSLLAADRGGGAGWLGRLRGEPPTDWGAWERFADATRSAVGIAMERFAASFQRLASIGLPLAQQQTDALVACMLDLLRVPSELAFHRESVA
jgi:hypothetical protein